MRPFFWCFSSVTRKLSKAACQEGLLPARVPLVRKPCFHIPELFGGPHRRAHIYNGCLVTELAEGGPELCHFVKRQLRVCWPFLSGGEGRKEPSSLSLQLHQNSGHVGLSLKVRSDSTSGVQHSYLMLAMNFNELGQ